VNLEGLRAGQIQAKRSARDEGGIESIPSRSDRPEDGRYNGLKNSHSQAGRSIVRGMDLIWSLPLFYSLRVTIGKAASEVLRVLIVCRRDIFCHFSKLSTNICTKLAIKRSDNS
jgi:hypothetical protein